MSDINSYGIQLSPEDIAAGKHREFVGGLWDELGRLQFEFMRSHGLRPEHRLLDIGCGCLRGGVEFVRYLDAGNYYGLDINASLIEAGRRELAGAGLADKRATLMVDDAFRVGRFGERFDAMISISLFTHLPMNHIIRCLAEAGRHLAKDGAYYATYFEAPRPAYLEPLTHQPGGVVTYYDADPFHYGFDELAWMAAQAGLEAERIGDWNHPRDQKMAVFRPTTAQ